MGRNSGKAYKVFALIAVKFGVSMRTWDSLPQAKFCKKIVLGQMYKLTKNYHSCGACKPTF